MPSVLCIHHAPCNDGAAAAAALAWRLRQNAPPPEENRGDPARDTIEVMPLSFGRTWEAPIDEEYITHLGHHDEIVTAIYIVDISLSSNRFAQIIAELKRQNRIAEEMPRVICIDHHQSAIERIDEISSYCDDTYIRIGPGLSGATLVWQYFDEQPGYEEVPMPELLRYVADQDIWEWKLPASREVNAALNTLDGMMPSLYDELVASIERPEEWMRLRRSQGESILSVIDSQIRRSFGNVTRKTSADGVEFMIVNATSNSSELGNRLCDDSDRTPDCVAMIYTVLEDWGVKVSVRTLSGGKLSAREVAERFGGGGHDNAAGCRFASLEEFRQALDELTAG